DAAAGLTPLRFGGEAAKFGGLLHASVPPTTAVFALALEAAITYPLVFAFGLGLAWAFAPSWWSQVRPLVEHSIATGLPWITVLLLGAPLAGVLGFRWYRRTRALDDTVRP